MTSPAWSIRGGWHRGAVTSSCGLPRGPTHSPNCLGSTIVTATWNRDRNVPVNRGDTPGACMTQGQSVCPRRPWGGMAVRMRPHGGRPGSLWWPARLPLDRLIVVRSSSRLPAAPSTRARSSGRRDSNSWKNGGSGSLRDLAHGASRCRHRLAYWAMRRRARSPPDPAPRAQSSQTFRRATSPSDRDRRSRSPLPSRDGRHTSRATSTRRRRPRPPG
jgi:hypothetical protein